MADVDFRSLLSTPCDDIKAPVAMPAGTYFGIITSFKFDKSREKQTPYVRFAIKLTGAGEDIDASILAQWKEESGQDVAGKEFYRDFYITKDALFRLNEFLQSLGLNTKGRVLDQVIPEAQNQSVMLELKQRIDQRDPTKVYNDIASVAGAN